MTRNLDSKNWINIGQDYINKKTQNVYKVVDYATHSETQECLIIYTQAQGIMAGKRKWARPQDLFIEKFTLLDGTNIEVPNFPTGLIEDPTSVEATLKRAKDSLNSAKKALENYKYES